MAELISREELLAAQQKKSPKKPHLQKKVDKKKQKEVELQEIITPSFINEVIY